LKVGAHGLPLIGTGDWNDGMNRVGELGRGENVWLGWLLYAALSSVAPLADARGDTARAATWRTHAAAVQAALEREAWDGEWYRRAWFDDGTLLGSATDEECRIDAISQSWAAISGAADRERAGCAMGAVERELIRPRDRVALLFTPHSTKHHSIRAISRATRRAFTRTAASTRMASCGRSWHSLRLRGRRGGHAVLPTQSHQPRLYAVRCAPVRG
jgi:cellobiose phosphorylase